MRQRKKIQKMLRPGHVRQCSERPPSLGLPARQGPADAKDHLLQTGQLAQGHEERNANKHPPMHKGARMRGPRKSLHYPGARHGGIGGVPTPSTKSGDRGVSGLTLSKTQRAGYSGSEQPLPIVRHVHQHPQSPEMARPQHGPIDGGHLRSLAGLRRGYQTVLRRRRKATLMSGLKAVGAGGCLLGG